MKCEQKHKDKHKEVFYRRQIKGLMYEIKFDLEINQKDRDKILLHLAVILEGGYHYHDIINVLLDDEYNKKGDYHGNHNMP